MGRGAGGRANATNLDNTELAAVDNISVFILPSIVNNVGQIGSRDRLGLHSLDMWAGFVNHATDSRWRLNLF